MVICGCCGGGGFYCGGSVVVLVCGEAMVAKEAVVVFCFGFLVVICGCCGWWYG